MKKRGKAISYILAVVLVLTTAGMPVAVLAAPVQTSSIIAAKVTITNNAGETRDVIYITNGTKSGDIIRLYKNGDMVFESAGAKGSSFRFEIPSHILDDKNDGTIDITIQGMNKGESVATPVSYTKAPQSLPPILKNIVVTNNIQDRSNSVYDRVNITGLRSGDVFYVYYENPTMGGVVMGNSGTATTKGTAEATLRTELPDTGPIWITVKSTGRTESEAVEVAVNAEDETRDPIFATATNNYGPNDKIMITGLYPGDQVEATEAGTGVVYGTGKVGLQRTDIEISAKANRTGLIATGGSIMIKVTTAGKTAAIAGPFPYEKELVSKPVATAPYSEYIGNMTSCGSVTIYNYENKLDQIQISDLLPGDQILITTNPADPQKEAELKNAAVSSKSTVFSSTLKLPDIVDGTSTGSIRIYVTSIGMQRSDYVVVEYSLSLRSSTPIDATQSGTPPSGVAVTAITNSAVKYGDTIFVTGVEKGDKIMIYDQPKAPEFGAQDTPLNAKSSGVVAASKTDVLVYAQFPKADAGSVYVSYIKPGLQESERVEVKYGAEKQTSIAGLSISLVNLAGDKDTLTVGGVPKDTLIQAYTTNGANYIGTAIKGSYVKAKNSTQDTVATFELPKLADNTGSGIIYVGLIIPGELESELIPVTYGPEPSQEWDTGKLKVQAVNVFGPLDYVVFSQFIDPAQPANSADMEGVTITYPTSEKYPGHTLMTAKTVITLYMSTDPAVKIKMGTLTINGQDTSVATSGGLEIQRIANSKAFNAGAGTIAYTVTYPGKAESARIPISYEAEEKTDISLLNATGNVQVVNNINTGTMPDYVNISTGSIVTAGSIIKVYNGNSTTAMAIGKTAVTVKMASEPAISIVLTGKNALGPDAGFVWVTVQEAGKAESDPVQITYGTEGGGQTPTISALSASAGQIYAIAVDNKGVNIKDFVFVFGLQPEDTVTMTFKTAATSTAKNQVYAAKVGAGQSSVTFNVCIYDVAWDDDDNGYITVTRKGMSESERISLKAVRTPGAGQ